MFIFREAIIADIPQMQIIRHLVKENRLSDPALVTDDDCRNFIIERGKGWVCENEHVVIGFAIADLEKNNVWALFVNPVYEGKRVGKTLHALMLNWYFEQTKENIWLGTEPGTRAEKFYRLQGWREAGMHGKEIKFEMDYEQWEILRSDKFT